MIQATEAIKLLIGMGDPLIGRLVTYDALGMRVREVKLRRDPKCPLCGESPSITDLSIHTEGGVAACAIDGDGHRAAAGASTARAGG